MIELGPNAYGKSAIRIVTVDRSTTPHRIRDLTVDVRLEGDFDAAHTAGDNAAVIATDTMKNTAYAFAAERREAPVEALAIALAEHFVEPAQVASARVDVREHAWRPVTTSGGRAASAFVRSDAGTRIARATAARDAPTAVEAGIEDLVVMRTAGSSFSGFARDRYTTLAETSDRILATSVTARWRYDPPPDDPDATWSAILDTWLEAFAEHDSPSVQATIWVVGRAILERHSEVAEIDMRLPNLHHWSVDLGPVGLPEATGVFVATREPYGLIEATVRRSDA